VAFEGETVPIAIALAFYSFVRGNPLQEKPSLLVSLTTRCYSPTTGTFFMWFHLSDIISLCMPISSADIVLHHRTSADQLELTIDIFFGRNNCTVMFQTSSSRTARTAINNRLLTDKPILSW